MIVPTPLLGPGATFFSTGYLIGGFAGACGGILIAGRNSVDAAVAISVVASAVSCQLYRCLPASRTIADESRSPRQSLGKALVFLKRSRACRVALVMMISSVAFFQGFQIIARAPLPISHWQGTAGTAVLAQLLASAAIVIGTVLPGVRRLTLLFDRYIEVWLLLTMVAMVACTIVTTPQLGLCLYFSFVGLFAVCFTKYQRDVMLYSEQAVMPAIATLMTTGSLGLMSMMIVAFGALADIIGITGISLAMAVAVIATATVAYFVPMPKARETAQ
jgi:hypothetical protein